MAYGILRGHYCDPDQVVSGKCNECGTTWTYTTSEWQITKSALKGNDVRDANGNILPLL
jgi:primosomal protein N'